MEGQEQVQDMGQLVGLLKVAAEAAGEPGTSDKNARKSSCIDCID